MQHPWQHFDLGVDVLAAGGEMQNVPQDWDPHGVHQREHNGGQWPPADPKKMQLWAATLDVPGF